MPTTTTFAPPLRWDEPMTPIGPVGQEYARLLGTVEIGGLPFHAEAIEIRTNDDGVQESVLPGDLTDSEEAFALIGSGAESVLELEGRDYILVIYPYGD